MGQLLKRLRVLIVCGILISVPVSGCTVATSREGVVQPAIALTGYCFPEDSGQAIVVPALPMTDTDPPARAINGGVAPRYPAELRRAETPGRVVALFLVDSAGRLERSSVQILESTDGRLSRSVCAWLASARFTPGRRAGRPVRAWTRQEFDFHMAHEGPHPPAA